MHQPGEREGAAFDGGDASLAGRELSIFLFRQFFALIPGDLRDAAIIDGCSELGVLFRVMLPLSKPVFVTAGIFVFMDTWNDFLWPMVTTMGHPELMTMPVGLAFFSQSYVTYWGASMAMATLFTVLVVVVYLFFQRYFVESLLLSSVIPSDRRESRNLLSKSHLPLRVEIPRFPSTMLRTGCYAPFDKLRAGHSE